MDFVRSAVTQTSFPCGTPRLLRLADVRFFGSSLVNELDNLIPGDPGQNDEISRGKGRDIPPRSPGIPSGSSGISSRKSFRFWDRLKKKIVYSSLNHSLVIN